VLFVLPPAPESFLASAGSRYSSTNFTDLPQQLERFLGLNRVDLETSITLLEGGILEVNRCALWVDGEPWEIPAELGKKFAEHILAAGEGQTQGGIAELVSYPARATAFSRRSTAKTRLKRWRNSWIRSLNSGA
jgi:hypothetical protein